MLKSLATMVVANTVISRLLAAAVLAPVKFMNFLLRCTDSKAAAVAFLTVADTCSAQEALSGELNAEGRTRGED